MVDKLEFVKGVPKIVQISVTDGKPQKKSAGGRKPKFPYYPVGIAFIRDKSGKGSKGSGHDSP